MPQNIILKRSALQGKVPTTSSLSLGEIAINTYDGKIFLNRSGSIQSIQEIITTNVVNTGSITLTQTGSFAELVVSQDGNFQRDVYVTRDIITNGSLDILYDVSASAFLGAIRATNGVISGSSQVNFTQISNISSGIVSSSAQIIALLPAGTISGSSPGIISSSAQLATLGYATTGSNSFKADQQITGSLGVSGDITVLGSVNARQFNIGIISSSILYTSGSTKFGDTQDDTMSVTGSLRVSGSTTITGSLSVTSLTTIATSFTTNSSSFLLTSGSNLIIQNNGLAEITGSLRVSGSQTITGSVTATSFTGSLFGTASFALNGSSNAIMYQTASAASTWVFNHFLATPYPVVTVYDNNNSVIIPQSITANDSSSLTITFSSARTGVAVASKGGYVGSAVATATVANALTTARLINGTSFDGTQNITIPNLVSGSSQISLAGTSDYASLFGGIALATASINTQFSTLGSLTGSFATTGSNVFRGNQTITGSLFVSGTILQNGGGLAVQDNTILYHSSSWFIPTSTVSTSGTTVTSVGTQFTSGMVGAKLTILRESKIITAFTSNTQVTVDSAYSQNYNSIPSGSWGVFSKSFANTDTDTNTNVFYDSFGNKKSYFDSNGNIIFTSTYGVFNNNLSTVKLAFTNVGLWNPSSGLIEVQDGRQTPTGLLSERRDLLLRNITGSNAFFSGSSTFTGSLGVSGSVTATAFNGTINATNGVVSSSSQIISILSSLNTYTGSNDTTNTTQNNRLTNLETTSASVNGHIADINSKTGSYARTNSANTFNGTQIVSGSLFVTQDLVVLGSSSIQNISSSNLVIGAAYITLNTFTPASRFAGINILDSGSAGSSGSFLYDAVQDEFIQVHKGNGTNITSSHFIQGPQTYDNLGNELYLTNNRLTKGTGLEHIVDSNISDTGTEISLNSLTSVTGSFIVTGGITGSIRATNGIVSGSSQVSIAGTSDYTSLFTGIASATSSLNSFSASQNTKDSTLATLTGSIETKFTSIGASTSSLNTYTASTDTRFSALQASTASLNVYTQSNDTVNTTQNNRLTALETATGSNTVVSQSIFFINNYTGSAFLSQSVVNARLTALEIASASLEVFTSSQNTKNSTLATYTGSNDTKWSNLAIYTASVDTKFGAIQSTTNSLNLFTSSILTALTASGVNLTANGNLTVQGNLTIAGTQTIINSTTVQLGDNIIELNGSSVANGGIFVKDPTAPTTGTGSFLWDSTNDFWRAGLSGSESRILVVGSMGVVSGSSQISIAGTSDYSSLFGGIASATSSLNSFSASENTKSSTLATYTGSIDTKFTAVAASTASLNLFTSSAALRLTNLETTSASVNISVSNINSYTTSVSNSIQQLSLKTGSYATTGSNAFIGNQTISGSLSIGSASVATENTLIIGAAPGGGAGEGGQLLLAAKNDAYTSASMFDNWQNSTRLLRGSNAGSDAVVTQWNMHTKQVSFPAYNSVSSFAGTAVANLAVDSGGNILTVSTSGASVFPYTGIASINGGLVVTGSITASGAIYAQANGQMYFRGGDDAELWDINVANTVGIYGQQDATIGSIKLGSGGGIISGRSGSIGIGITTPTSGSLHVNGNIFATSITGAIAATNGVVSSSAQVLGGSGVYSGSIVAATRLFTFQDLALGSGTTQGIITTDGNKPIVVRPFGISSNTTTQFWPQGGVTIKNGGTFTYNGLALDVSGSVGISGSTSITGSLVVTNGITGSLFGTASFALNGSSNAILYQTASAASIWTFNHFLATPYPVVTVYDNNNSVIIPQSIVSNDSSSLTITFSSARTGVAVASKGGYVGSSVGIATTANALSTARLINGTAFDGTQNITIPNLVSGSTQISLAGTSDYSSLFGGIASATASLNSYTASNINTSLNLFTASINTKFSTLGSLTGSFATTGSNTFIGNEIISGSLIVNGRTTLSGSLSLSPSQSAFLVSHSISQSATAGATVYGVNITPLFTNGATSQTQTALRVMPTFTGSFSGSNTANIIADFGATSVGSQFTINDVVSGSIYMVNDVSGLPIIEALSDGQVNMYDFPYKAFNKSGSYLSLGTSLTPSSSVTVQSDFIINKGYGLYSRTTQASGSTVSNVTSSLFNLVFSNVSSSVFMSAVVTGYDTGSRQTVTGDVKSTIKYNAGVASIVGYNQKFLNSEVANVNFDIVASSTSASLLVYGSGSTTYRWGATITYQVI
jgi:hypothetical protein